MLISVLGATGPSGLHFVKQAVAAGHTVQALVRNPDKIDPDLKSASSLEVVPDVDVFSGDNLARGFEGSDVVVSCLGTKPTLMPWGSEITFYSESIKSIVDGMRKKNIPKLVAMTSWYTDDHPSYGIFVRWFLKPLFIGRNLDDMFRMETYLEEKCHDINYTVVRPPGLGPNGPTELNIQEAVGAQNVPGKSPMKTTERGDVAKFLLKAATQGGYDKKFVAIST